MANAAATSLSRRGAPEHLRVRLQLQPRALKGNIMRTFGDGTTAKRIAPSGGGTLVVAEKPQPIALTPHMPGGGASVTPVRVAATQTDMHNFSIVPALRPALLPHHPNPKRLRVHSVKKSRETLARKKE